MLGRYIRPIFYAGEQTSPAADRTDLFKLKICFMSKSIISVVLRLIAFALSALPKAVNSILALIDLVDDGCINNSVTRPEWVTDLLDIVDQINSVGSALTHVQSKVRETPTVD